MVQPRHHTLPGIDGRGGSHRVRRPGVSRHGSGRGKPVTADSVRLTHPAEHATDADPTTRWCAADNATGHWLQVDLGRSAEVTGTPVVWEFARNYRYQVAVSSDGAAFTTVADKTGSLSTEATQDDAIKASGRYVRVTVTGLGTGARLTAEWYNVATGTTQSAGTVGNGRATFTSPWSTPALLHLGAA